jgi:DNA-binding transcriptional MerR regulator
VVDEALTAGAVARRLGVAVTTLRTWHQRYGLGPSEHAPGQHRRYTPEDLDRLQVMRRLTAQGVAPAEAAAWARRMPADTDLVGLAPAPAASRSPSGSRDGGGHAIPLGPARPAARGLARAAVRLDAPAMRDIIHNAVSEIGVIEAWDEVLVPVLAGVGERYEATKRFVEVEHLLSRSITEVFGSVSRPGNGVMPKALLAAADEEQHTLALEALAAALAEAGVPTRLFGARVPSQALLDAVARTGPVVVVLWSQLPGTGDAAQLAQLAEAPHPPLVIAAAGPGWPAELPDGVVRLSGLAQAVSLVTAAVA